MSARAVSKKISFELVCPCNNRLTVTVGSVGWRLSLVAAAMADHWHIPAGYDVEQDQEIEARCPHCHSTRHTAL